MPPEPIDLGTRLELLVDDHLIERMAGGATLRLHQPVRREAALVTDAAWEGNMCGYVTVFQDNGLFRMYYHGWHAILEQGRIEQPYFHIAYAQSQDGIHWHRPELGLWEFRGSARNSIVWPGLGDELIGTHGFAPFVDANPASTHSARYKALGAPYDSTRGLYALGSPDGLRWRLLQDTPIVVGPAFDSQNLAFWDAVRGQYRAYVRDFREGCRSILTATSDDFLHWTEPVPLEYPNAPREELYTNQVIPYYRAPHLFVGFPTRYVERSWSAAIEDLPELEHRRLRASVSERYGAALTDGLFMSSRDGRTFKRWGEAFLRPGLRSAGNWTYGDNYQAWGLLETASDLAGAPPELSMYATEGYWRGHATCFRRYTLRLDGFVSVQAPLSGGEFTTRPCCFAGATLTLNVATSAAGSVRVEIQDAEGRPIPGYSLADSVEVIGDELARVVRWQDGADLSQLRGRTVRLRFALADADLYAIRFAPST